MIARTGAIALACLAVLAGVALAPRPALADEALIDVGMSQAWMRVSHLPGTKTLPATGITARWMFVDGSGELMLGGKITAWKPLWDEQGELDNLWLDLEFNLEAGGRFKHKKVNVAPFFGIAAGLRNLVLNSQSPNSRVLSGFGVTLSMGVHGYVGRDSGFFWRICGFGSGHLLFPDPGWTGGGGVEITLGAYLD